MPIVHQPEVDHLVTRQRLIPLHRRAQVAKSRGRDDVEALPQQVLADAQPHVEAARSAVNDEDGRPIPRLCHFYRAGSSRHQTAFPNQAGSGGAHVRAERQP